MAGEVFNLNQQFEEAFLRTLALEDVRPFAAQAVSRLTADAPVKIELGNEALEQIIDGGGIISAQGIFNYAAQALAPERIAGWIAAHEAPAADETLQITAVGERFAAQWKAPSPA